MTNDNTGTTIQKGSVDEVAQLPKITNRRKIPGKTLTPKLQTENPQELSDMPGPSQDPKTEMLNMPSPSADPQPGTLYILNESE